MIGIMLVVLMVVFTIVMYYFIVQQQSVNVHFKFFHEPSPDRIISYYRKNYAAMRKFKDKDAHEAYSIALVHVYYGDFNVAEDLIEGIDWDERSFMMQSMHMSMKALLAFMRDKDYQEGLRLSLIAQSLAHQMPEDARTKLNEEFHSIYVDVGILLAEGPKESAIQHLESRFEHASFYVKLLIAGCLAKVYGVLGRTEDQKMMLDYCQETAPYCKGIQEL